MRVRHGRASGLTVRRRAPDTARARLGNRVVRDAKTKDGDACSYAK